MRTHELIVSPFLGSYLVVRPGQRNAIKISQARYAQLWAAGTAESSPDWLADAAKQGYRGLLSSGYYLDLNYSTTSHYTVDPMSGDGAAASNASWLARNRVWMFIMFRQ